MTMDVPAMYQPYLTNQTRLSTLVAYLPDAEPPDFAALATGLARLGVSPDLVSVNTLPDGDEVIDVAAGKRTNAVRLRAGRPPLLDAHVRETMRLDESTRAAVEQCRAALFVEMKYAAMPIADLGEQLQFAYALCPSLLAVLDVSAQKLRDRAWVTRFATARTPPPPTALFIVHALPDHQGTWLHTHGLLRCAGLEFELGEVPERAVPQAGGLLNVVGPHLVEHRVPPGEPFAVSEQVTLCWLPWQDERVRAGRPANERTPLHQGPGAVLVTPGDFRPAHTVLEAFSQSRTSVGSRMGRVRDQLLAQDTLPQLARLHATRGGVAGWQFEVKLVASPTRHEFMWFRLERLTDTEVVGTLVSSPLAGSTLTPGAQVTRPTADVVDWVVGSPSGVIRPSTLDAPTA